MTDHTAPHQTDAPSAHGPTRHRAAHAAEPSEDATPTRKLTRDRPPPELARGAQLGLRTGTGKPFGDPEAHVALGNGLRAPRFVPAS